jgi:large subunit ribosomal protein L18e
MGIDISRRVKRKSVRRAPKSENVYIRLLAKLYNYLARRTGSKFNDKVLKRLFMSRRNRPPLSISRLCRHMKKTGRQNKIAVVVGSITDDPRLLSEMIPKGLTLCALRLSARARSRILQAGGTILTVDELAVRSPCGENTVLLQGRRNAREAVKHFGAAGVPHSNAKPYIRQHRGRKFERARGRRKSRGYKV